MDAVSCLESKWERRVAAGGVPGAIRPQVHLKLLGPQHLKLLGR